MTDLIAYTTDKAMTFCVEGFAPNGFVAHRFGNGQDIRGFFNPESYADLKLKLTQGGAGGAGSVIVQQIRT